MMKSKSCTRLLPLCLNIVLASLIASVPAQGQTDRFELGQRLRACESAWETQYNPESRRTAVKHLQQAVQLFFALKLNDAAQALDAARLALRWPNEPTPFARWAESVFVKMDSHLIDAGDTALPFTVTTAYLDTTGIQPREPNLRVSLWRGKQSLGKPYEIKLSKLPLNDKLPLKNLGDGDFTLRSEILLNGKLLASSEQTLSAAKNLRARLDQLQQALGALRQISTDAESARALVKLLDQLAQKQAPETNFPATRLLGEAEALLLKAGIAQGFYGHRKTGQYWLTLSLASGTVPVRLLAPATAKSGEPLPLVLAMHGAGGSENLFFDGYGVGKIATLSESRGWLVVAPRGSAGFTPQRAGEIIDAVDKLYRVDRERVFLVGHSMGAAQAIASVQATPTRFAAVAALGGGGMVKETEGMSTVPFLVAVGAQDFAYSNARKLAYELKKAGVKSVRFKEYPDVEHLIIVQEALPDVFAFFDEMSRR